VGVALSLRAWREFSAFDAADAFFEQAEAFVQLGERAELDFDGPGQVVEGAEHCCCLRASAGFLRILSPGFAAGWDAWGS